MKLSEMTTRKPRTIQEYMRVLVAKSEFSGERHLDFKVTGKMDVAALHDNPEIQKKLRTKYKEDPNKMEIMATCPWFYSDLVVWIQGKDLIATGSVEAYYDDGHTIDQKAVDFRLPNLTDFSPAKGGDKIQVKLYNYFKQLFKEELKDS
jgi:hypothetical protein